MKPNPHPRPKAAPEKILVLSNPKEGVIERRHAVGEYRTNRYYRERRENGWKSLREWFKSKGMIYD